MQMKMEKKRPHNIDKKKLRQILETEDEFITTLFDCFEVPESHEGIAFYTIEFCSKHWNFGYILIRFSVCFCIDNNLEQQFLLKSKEKAGKSKSKPSADEQKSSVDIEQRLEIIRNKMKSKKVKPSARAIEKKRQKKLKKTKELKKKIISAAKSIKNEKVKEGKVPNAAAATDSNGADIKPDVKPDVKPKVFNEQANLVFPKFEFAARPSQAKKSKKDSE